MRASAIILLTVFLPLLGAWISGRDLQPIFEFPPPLEIPIGYTRFSWIAAFLVLAPLVGFVAAWKRSRRRSDNVAEAATAFARNAWPFFAPSELRRGRRVPLRMEFPWWGYLALSWTLVWWVFAWTRFGWFAPIQPYTFFPLWLGFIVVVNALVRSRTRSCLMVRAPGQWVALFLASAAFWWLFEWLNRFAQNWHYLGAEEFSALGYGAHATLCFSTVLPAVYAVKELCQGLGAGQSRPGPRWAVLHRTGAGVVLVAVGIAALVGTGALPRYFYPALWVAPLLLAAGFGIVRRQEGIWSEIAAGDWSNTLPWMLSALSCGFFWEMWNYFSLTKWAYTVPYCERWHLFEMPALGYAGYLPFGAECALVAHLVVGTARPPSPEAT